MFHSRMGRDVDRCPVDAPDDTLPGNESPIVAMATGHLMRTTTFPLARPCAR